MKRTSLLFGIGGLATLLANAAVCHAYQATAVPASLPCEPTPATHTKATPCCGKQADPLVSGKPCCQAACCAVAAKAAAASPAAKQPNVYDLLEKLEALKAKQDALESEVRETRALLNEKFRTLQERVGKVGVGGPTPVVTGVPVTGQRYYEPVTSYQVVLVKDPQTGETKRVATAVTSYVLREGVPAVPPVGPPAGAAVPPPAPPACVPAPATVPAHTDALPAPVAPESRPGPVKPAADSPEETRPQPKNPPTATPSPK